MVEKNNIVPGAGNEGSKQEEHRDAEFQRRENDPPVQPDSLPNQQPDPASDASEQLERQPTPVQQPDTRLNESHEPGSLSAADVQGGLPG